MEKNKKYIPKGIDSFHVWRFTNQLSKRKYGEVLRQDYNIYPPEDLEISYELLLERLKKDNK